MRQGVSIVWDKNEKFFQVWPFDYKGDGQDHAEKVATTIGGTFKHIDDKED